MCGVLRACLLPFFPLISGSHAREAFNIFLISLVFIVIVGVFSLLSGYLGVRCLCFVTVASCLINHGEILLLRFLATDSTGGNRKREE